MKTPVPHQQPHRRIPHRRKNLLHPLVRRRLLHIRLAHPQKCLLHRRLRRLQFLQKHSLRRIFPQLRHRRRSRHEQLFPPRRRLEIHRRNVAEKHPLQAKMPQQPCRMIHPRLGLLHHLLVRQILHRLLDQPKPHPIAFDHMILQRHAILLKRNPRQPKRRRRNVKTGFHKT